MDKHEKETFSYSYSAKQQEEIKKIREKYSPQEKAEENNIDRLRRLDGGVTKKANIISLIVGIIGTLIMGGGMSLCLVGDSEYFIAGVIIGAVGIIVLSLAYPIYTGIVKRERKRIAPEIIRLTDELMK